MKLSDFSSVLQLGVGLHTGTVLLQSIVEFASAPVFSRVDRLIRVAELRIGRLRKQNKPTGDAEGILNELNDVRGALLLKRVQFFHEYKIAAGANAVVALILYGLLCWGAVDADYVVNAYFATLLIAVSALPAIGSIALLWWRWRINTASAVSQVTKCQHSLFDK